MTSKTGFQPRNTPAERRAFFEQKRLIDEANGAAQEAADAAGELNAATKTYVDGLDAAQKTYVDGLDATQKTYIDGLDATQKTYIDTKDTTQQTYIDDRLPYIYAGTPSGGATSGTGVANANTLTIPAWHIPARILVTCNTRIDKSVVGDSFIVKITNVNTSTDLAEEWPCLNGASQYTATLTAMTTTVANVALVLRTRIQRTAGTGTATFYSTASQNVLTGLWIADG